MAGRVDHVHGTKPVLYLAVGSKDSCGGVAIDTKENSFDTRPS